jgi:hypothetical protein
MRAEGDFRRKVIMQIRWRKTKEKKREIST